MDDIQKINEIEKLPRIVDLLTSILDNWLRIPGNYNGNYRSKVEETINHIFRQFPKIGSSNAFVKIDFESRTEILPPSGDQCLVLDVSKFPVEGIQSAANFIVDAYLLGWSHIYAFDWRGQRFAGVGLGKGSAGFRLDIYGNPGDYLASGLDGAEIYVHASAQDQVGQMMKSGKLVIYGDVGQTLLYGAKGGEIFVMGNAAGRPLINAVGRPRLVINGTCLDYLAESFMAGDPLRDGGFAIVNGLYYDGNGIVQNLETPYAGGNLFSLASGGAIYIRDPNSQIEKNQLHGGMIENLNPGDIDVIHTYLLANQTLFGIPPMDKTDIQLQFLKICPQKVKVLSNH